MYVNLMSAATYELHLSHIKGPGACMCTVQSLKGDVFLKGGPCLCCVKRRLPCCPCSAAALHLCLLLHISQLYFVHMPCLPFYKIVCEDSRASNQPPAISSSRVQGVRVHRESPVTLRGEGQSTLTIQPGCFSAYCTACRAEPCTS